MCKSIALPYALLTPPTSPFREQIAKFRSQWWVFLPPHSRFHAICANLNQIFSNFFRPHFLSFTPDSDQLELWTSFPWARLVLLPKLLPCESTPDDVPEKVSQLHLRKFRSQIDFDRTSPFLKSIEKLLDTKLPHSPCSLLVVQLWDQHSRFVAV